MAKRTRRRQRSSGGFSIASFIAGVVVGCLASILVAATAVPVLDNYQPDTAGFSNIDIAEPAYEYEFPDILEASGSREQSATPIVELVSVPDAETGAEPLAIDNPIGSFLLQAGSFEQQRHADVFRATLMLRGYQAKTTLIEIPDKGPRYRVVIGPYPSQTEAQAAIDRLKSEKVEAVMLGIRET